MKKIKAACIVRDLRFDTLIAREGYIDNQIRLARQKHQPEPWRAIYDADDPAFPFGLLCGTAYNANPMWTPAFMKLGRKGTT